jgi:hypothetical protein
MDDTPIVSTELQSDKPLSELILESAIALLGRTGAGDQIAVLVGKTLERSGVQFEAPTLDYRQWLYEVTAAGNRVPYETAQAGDVGVLEYASEDHYWIYVVRKVTQHTMILIAASAYGDGDKTTVVEIEIGRPDFREPWHTIAIIRF